MNPFYFGTRARRLFGMYTPARVRTATARAVVVCAPWGQEYLASHRSMRQLAVQLSEAGFDVLRFDYYGTGDSSGEMRETDVAGWLGDIGAAIDELKDTAGATKVGLAGLRLGGTLAAAVAAKRRADVDALALWDPVASGDAWLSELMRETAALAPGDASEHEVGGFPLTQRMAAEIRALDLVDPKAEVRARTLVVMTTEDDVALWRSAFARRFRGPLEVEFMQDTPAWLEHVSFQTGAVPVKVLRRMVEWFR